MTLLAPLKWPPSELLRPDDRLPPAGSPGWSAPESLSAGTPSLLRPATPGALPPAALPGAVLERPLVDDDGLPLRSCPPAAVSAASRGVPFPLPVAPSRGVMVDRLDPAPTPELFLARSSAAERRWAGPADGVNGSPRSGGAGLPPWRAEGPPSSSASASRWRTRSASPMLFLRARGRSPAGVVLSARPAVGAPVAPPDAGAADPAAVDPLCGRPSPPDVRAEKSVMVRRGVLCVPHNAGKGDACETSFPWTDRGPSLLLCDRLPTHRWGVFGLKGAAAAGLLMR